MHVLEKSRDPIFYINIAFVEPSGRLLGLLEEMEGACRRALNRLPAGQVGHQNDSKSQQ